MPRLTLQGGGAGSLYYYNHIHSADNDVYKSEGSSWATAYAINNPEPFLAGPAGSIYNPADPILPASARFYYSGYIGEHSLTRPGIRIGLRIQDTLPLAVKISNHTRFDFDWITFDKTNDVEIPVVLRENHQSVHTEGNNVWIQVSGPASAKVGDTVTISAYGELLNDSGLYNGSLVRTDTSGVTTDLIRTDGIIGNEFGPETVSYQVTTGGEEICESGMQDIGSVPEGAPQSVQLNYNVYGCIKTLPEIIGQLNELLGREDISDEVKTYLQSALGACYAMQSVISVAPPDSLAFLSQMIVAVDNIALAARQGNLDIWCEIDALINIRAEVVQSVYFASESKILVSQMKDASVTDEAFSYYRQDQRLISELMTLMLSGTHLQIMDKMIELDNTLAILQGLGYPVEGNRAYQVGLMVQWLDAQLNNFENSGAPESENPIIPALRNITNNTRQLYSQGDYSAALTESRQFCAYLSPDPIPYMHQFLTFHGCPCSIVDYGITGGKIIEPVLKNTGATYTHCGLKIGLELLGKDGLELKDIDYWYFGCLGGHTIITEELLVFVPCSKPMPAVEITDEITRITWYFEGQGRMEGKGKASIYYIPPELAIGASAEGTLVVEVFDGRGNTQSDYYNGIYDIKVTRKDITQYDVSINLRQKNDPQPEIMILDDEPCGCGCDPKYKWAKGLPVERNNDAGELDGNIPVDVPVIAKTPTARDSDSLRVYCLGGGMGCAPHEGVYSQKDTVSYQWSVNPAESGEFPLSGSGKEVVFVAKKPGPLTLTSEVNNLSTVQYGDKIQPKIKFNLQTVAVQVGLNIDGVNEKEEETKGGFLMVNDDDDNNNGIPDFDPNETTVNKEDDLKEITLDIKGVNQGTVTLEVNGNGADKIKVWMNKTKGGAPDDDVTLPHAWDVSRMPKKLYVEGIKGSDKERDIELRLIWNQSSSAKYQFVDKVRLTVVGINLLDSNDNITNILKVAKWQGAFDPGPTVKSNFIDALPDPDRFFIRIVDASIKGKGKIPIKLSADSPGTNYDNDATESELDETPANSGIFKSKSQMLMSDKIDDEHKVDSITDNDKNDRTYIVALGGKVKIEYETVSGVKLIREANVPAPKEIKTVGVNIVILRNKAKKDGGTPVITESDVIKDWELAVERYAQIGVTITYSVIISDPPAGVNLNNGLTEFTSGSNPTTEEKALLNGLGTSTKNDIYIFYVNYLSDDSRGEAFVDSLLSGGNDKYSYNVIISASNPSNPLGTRGPFTFPHELGHLLLNDGSHHSEQINLMRSGTSLTNGVTESKRLTPTQETTIRSNSHVK